MPVVTETETIATIYPSYLEPLNVIEAALGGRERSTIGPSHYLRLVTKASVDVYEIPLHSTATALLEVYRDLVDAMGGDIMRHLASGICQLPSIL